MRCLRPLTITALCGPIAAVTLIGCGGSGVPPATTPKAASPTAAARRQLADSQSPAAAVARFWGSVQRGALPLSLSLYDPKVVSAVGLGTFAGMLNQQRVPALATQLKVLRIEHVAGGQLVTAEAVPTAGPKISHSFFLKRPETERRGPWRIVYDTLSAAAIGAYVQDQTQRSIDPAVTPGRKALSAGDAATAAYREAALGSPKGAASRSSTTTGTATTSSRSATTTAP